MDEHEKHRDIHRAIHDDDVNKVQDSMSANIPLDLILEILSRVPAKSILRFRCVSKQWSSFTKDQSFINSFASRSSTRPLTLLITLGARLNNSAILFPQLCHDLSISYPPIYNYQITYANRFKYPLSESVHGLILVDIFKIWNPSLRRVIIMPDPNENKQNYKFCFLGYDPLESKHKLLCLLSEEYFEPAYVLTLEAQESWRHITKGNHMHSPENPFARCFNGILYYAAYDREQHIIMSFDVNSETFNPIKIPNHSFFSILTYQMIHYNGRLALVDFERPFNKIDLYILKDASGNDWMHVQFLDLVCNSEWKINTIRLVCKGISDDGKLIFSPYIFSGSFYILYFDMKKNNIREIWFKEILNGTRYDDGYSIEVFPNYIESLVSL